MSWSTKSKGWDKILFLIILIPLKSYKNIKSIYTSLLTIQMLFSTLHISNITILNYLY